MKTSYEFQFGIIELEYEENLLIGLRCNPQSREITEDELQGRSEFTDSVMQQVNEYLAGTRKNFDIEFELRGTDFQKKVWQVLLEIPYGETRSYKQIAEMTGNPQASRAVGMANNKNPLLLIVPCHRVIGADGSLTGYSGGLAMKQYLLELEQRNKMS